MSEEITLAASDLADLDRLRAENERLRAMLDTERADAATLARSNRMTERQPFAALVEKLPAFDPAWPAELCQIWIDCFTRLWRRGCRLEVKEAIERKVRDA